MTKRNSPWNNTKAAAAGASLTANRHVCASPEVWKIFIQKMLASNYVYASLQVDLDKAFIIMDDSFTTSAGSGGQRIPFNQNLAISCWTEKELDVEVCIAPNLVCSDAKQTCGGGDNISAAGLYPQIWNGTHIFRCFWYILWWSKISTKCTSIRTPCVFNGPDPNISPFSSRHIGKSPSPKSSCFHYVFKRKWVPK